MLAGSTVYRRRVLVLVAVSSVQFGAALAKTLFDEVGTGGTVFLRVLFAALVLMAIWRPAAARPNARATGA